MKKQKYYIPELTEFKEGFEYEFHTMTDKGSIYTPKEDVVEKKIYSKECINAGNICSRSLSTIKDMLHDGSIRVKYLDENDIKELGWKESRHKELNWFKLNKFILFKHNSSNLLSIESFNEIQYFRGRIKNKHELKLIMEKIGV